MHKLISPLKPHELALFNGLAHFLKHDEDGLTYAVFESAESLYVAQVTLASERYGLGVTDHHVNADEATYHLS